jgi:D-glycero-alpha-D-manno-heptose 1-phosphate guanylyltransferase
MIPVTLKNIDAVILCGGMGTRFQKVRNDIPKALAPIGSRLFIDLIVDDLIAQGIRRIVLAVGHLKEQIEAHFQNRKDAEFLISAESKPLGTGGAIKNAEEFLKSDSILLLNGDSKVQISYSNFLHFHLEKRHLFTMVVSSATRGYDYGNVLIGPKGEMVQFTEKPVAETSSLINAGVYLFQRSLLNSFDCKKPRSLERDLLPDWVSHNWVQCWQTSESVCDIGTVDRYEKACEVLIRNNK